MNTPPSAFNIRVAALGLAAALLGVLLGLLLSIVAHPWMFGTGALLAAIATVAAVARNAGTLSPPPKHTMHYFKNESESERIGDLTLDNRLDRVTVSGDVDLTLDVPGLALAEALAARLAAIVTAMKAVQAQGDLPAKVQTVEPTPAGNLFGQPLPDDGKARG